MKRILPWLFLIACGAPPKNLSLPAAAQNDSQASTVTTMPVFQSGMKSGWSVNDGWSWGGGAGTISGSQMQVKIPAGGGLTLDRLDGNGASANVTLAGFTALSFDVTDTSGLSISISQGNGYDSKQGPVLLASNYVSSSSGGVSHVSIPLSALQTGLTSVFEIAFHNEVSSTLNFSLANILLEAATTPAGPPKAPAGAMSIYASGLQSGWMDWSWSLATDIEPRRQGTQGKVLQIPRGV